ncbi:MAG: Gfo/Idh/MocA family oxidoreductase [Gordonia sp. (in: high G+C Gram-positive bacteria)]
MKVVLFGSGGAVGRHAARRLAAELGPDDELVLVGRRGTTPSLPNGGPRSVVVDLRLPLAGWPDELHAADVVLSCAGPSYRYSPALARWCAEQGVAYVDAGGDQRLIDELAGASSPILLGAGVQPGLIAHLVARTAEPGADVLVLCGGAQPLSEAAVGEYAHSVTDPDGWPGRVWDGGEIVVDDGAPPVPPSRTASVHAHLDPECAVTAQRLGLQRLRCFNVIDAPATAGALGAMVSGEGSIDAVLAAAAVDERRRAETGSEPYFTIAVTSHGPHAVRRSRIRVADSYALSGAVAAATALATPREPAGARWASASAASDAWDDLVDVRYDSREAVVIGGTFGRVYAEAFADPLATVRLAGVSGAGGGRSAALAEQFGVPVLRGAVSGPDVAVVAVRADIVGGPGDDVVDALLRQRVSVLQEHPVDVASIARHLRLAADHGVRYAPTGFYEHLPTAQSWITATAQLRARGGIRAVSVRTSMQVLERALLIVGDALAAVPLDPATVVPLRPGAFTVTADWGGIPVDVVVNNRRDPDDPDANSHPLFSAAVVTGDGELSWPHVHAPLQWTPHPSEEGHAVWSPSITTSAAPPHRLWATAAEDSVRSLLDTPAPVTPISQRHLAVIEWWQELCSRAPEPETVTARDLIGVHR